jgi:hypothetical protein
VAGVQIQQTYFFNFKILFKMKNLDLNAYGVYEMNDVEVRDVDGGIFFGWADVLLFGINIRCTPPGVLSA